MSDFFLFITTAAQIEAAALHQKRIGAVITKSAFCIALAELGIITNDECVECAQGHWPEGFKGFLEYLSEAGA